MASQSKPFSLTREHVNSVFQLLGETEDLEKRNAFFRDYVVPDVKWVMTGSAHALVGTTHDLEKHNKATFERLGKKLRGPIKFVVKNIVLDAGTDWACVEVQGEATRKNGKPYDNEYIWLTRWNSDGKIVEIRSYFDTMLAQQVLDDPE